MPGRYLVALIAVLLCLFIVLFGMQFPKSRIFILEIVLSILIDAVPGLGAYYVGRTSHLLDNIGGTVYKADNMIAVVRADAADTGRKVAQRVGKGGRNMYVDPIMAMVCAVAAGIAGIIIFAKRNLRRSHTTAAEH